MATRFEIGAGMTCRSVAFFLALGVAGCSSASPPTGGLGTGQEGPTGPSNNGSTNNGASTGQGGGGGGGGGGGTQTGGSGSTASSGGSSTPSGPSAGTGSSGSGPSSGSGSKAGSSSGSGTTPSDGGVAPTRGCGQGTSCMPGNDLTPPAAGQGYQIATPPGAITVQPGQESFLCYYKTLPNTSEFDVGKIQSWMTPGSSHHFIAYQQTAGAAADGTLSACSFGGGTWMYATSLPGEIIELAMPQGVGLPLPAGTQIMLNMHFINTGSTPVTPQVKMNVVAAQSLQYRAGAMVSFNATINVPPASAAGPGKQTVYGTCTAAAGSKFFVMTTHTHKHAVESKVNYVSGGQTTNLVDTTDWEHPDVGLWNAPNFLTVKAGDSFTYSCAYQNTGTTAVTVGETAASNEMCMAIGYYFPAGGAACQ